MKIVRPYARIMHWNEIEGSTSLETNILRHLEWCARISHRSEDDQKEGSAENLLRRVVLEHGDWSVTEHVVISADILTDRGVTHEIVRHRLASYTQESTRFVNYVKKMPPSFIYPDPEVECEHCLAGNEAWSFNQEDDYEHTIEREPNGSPCAYDKDWMSLIAHSERTYRKLLEKRWAPQKARSVFPNALSSRIIVTMNPRSWRQFFLMRTTKEAHPQMRQIMNPLLEEFKKMVPVLYDDIEPGARQVDNLKKGR